MSSNKSPGNARSDNTGGGGNASSKQGNEQQSGARKEPGRADPSGDQGPHSGEAAKNGESGTKQGGKS